MPALTALFHSPSFQACFAMLLAVSSVFIFSDATLVLFIIVFGQVHFLLSYFYTNKSGRMNRSYATRFFWVLLGSGALAVLVFWQPTYFPWLILLTGAIFAAHYTTDEIQLFSLEHVLYRVVGVLGMTITWSAVFVERLFIEKATLVAFLTVFGACLAMVFLWANRQWLRQSFSHRFFAVWYLLHMLFSIAAAFFFDGMSINQVLGIIVLTHYAHWYLFSALRYGRKELSFYLDTILWGHVLVLLMFTLYALAPHSGVLFLFFHPAFFYGWTLIHILMTFRPQDLSRQTL